VCCDALCLLLGHPTLACQCLLLRVKRTSSGHASMSAFDAVDGARPAASKCYRLVASNAERLKEVRPGNDGVLKFSRNWRGHDDVMQTRSIRGSGEPAWVNASFECVLSIGPALWPAALPPHKQAGHMTAPDQCCSSVRKFLPRRRPHMTQSRHRPPLQAANFSRYDDSFERESGNEAARNHRPSRWRGGRITVCDARTSG